MKTDVSTALRPGIESEKDDAGAADETPFDPIAFDAAMKKWRGYLREQLLADGYTTTEALMKDIRGR